MHTIYLDEAGFTGSDLFSSEQPVFVVGSLRLSPGDVASMIAPLQAATQAPEVKFKYLRRSRHGREAVLGFIAALDQRQADIYCQVVHKKYALLAKLLDAIVEPLYHESGDDFYRDGYNLRILNVLFWSAYLAGANRELDTVLAATQSLCREPTSRNLDTLQQAVSDLAQRSKPLKELCAVVIRALQWRRMRYGVGDLDNSVLRLQSSSVVSIIRAWNQQERSDLVVITDESKELVNDEDVLAAFSDPTMPHVVERADGREIGYPLRIANITFEKSHQNAGVQLADVLAGATEFVYRYVNELGVEEEAAPFAKQIASKVKEWPRMLQVVPEPKFTAEQLGRVGFDGSRVLNAAVDSLNRRAARRR